MLRLNFLRLFSWFQYMILYKKFSGKKGLLQWKMHVKKDVYNHGKKEFWYLKHLWAYSICRCIEEKSVSRKRLRLDLIFPRHRTFVSLGVINSCDLIFWDFIGRHHIILGKKVSGIYKTLDFISRGILSWDLKGL